MEPDIITGTMAAVEELDRVTTTDLVANKWPQWRVDLLKQLWAEGFTSGQIATRLDTTRNSIAGKKWRLGLTRRQTNHTPDAVSRERRAKKAARERERREKRKQPGYIKPPVPPQDVYMAATTKIASLGVPLEQLRWNGTQPANCRAIISPDKASPVLYCGLPNWTGESYCYGHCLKFFNRFSPGNIGVASKQLR